MAPERHEINLGEFLRDARTNQYTFVLPLALDQRLDALIARAVAAGETASRRDLLGAILLDVDATGDELGVMLKAFRSATNGQAVMDLKPSAGNVVELSTHRPGRRAARRT